MITLQEAHKILRSVNFQYESFKADFSDALGYILAEDLFSDIDMPPFDKSAVDGYACRMCDLQNPFQLIEFIPAGTLPQKEITENTCSKIMTGAKVPEGADCIFMVEDSEMLTDGSVRFTGKNTKSNICKLGEDVKNGQKVISCGTIITPAVIGVAASIGKTKLKVSKPPKIALLATGDEIIEPDDFPSGPFIRNSNPYNLMAQIGQTPAKAEYLGIVADNESALQQSIENAIHNSEILVITGGVSMGDRDYVPGILKSLGFEIAFDTLAIQPGKPIVFAYGKGKYCFALSGNPVSSMLQFELLVRPFIYWFMNHDYQTPFIKVRIANEKARKNPERYQFFPISLKNGIAHPIEFHGSAHITGLIDADGFGTFEVGKTNINKNEEIDVLLLKY